MMVVHTAIVTVGWLGVAAIITPLLGAVLALREYGK